MKIAFIGGGNMGEAMLAAVIRKRLTLPRNITVSEIKDDRRKYLTEKYAVKVVKDNRQAIAQADVIVLAVKPQSLGEVLSELSGQLKPKQLVLSIIAGARIKTLRSGLEHLRIVRSMPNTPAQIGEGITVWTATPQVTEKQKRQAQAILGAMGQEVYTPDEKQIDMATAVSGSGPAYFFYFVEALTEAAVKLGLPAEAAGKMVLQTMIGAGHLLKQSDQSPAELRRRVTSPGGTTAAAIEHLEEGHFAQLILEAVQAAHKRAKELGK